MELIDFLPLWIIGAAWTAALFKDDCGDTAAELFFCLISLFVWPLLLPGVLIKRWVDRH